MHVNSPRHVLFHHTSLKQKYSLFLSQYFTDFSWSENDETHPSMHVSECVLQNEEK